MAKVVSISSLENYVKTEEKDWCVEGYLLYAQEPKEFKSGNGQFLRFGLMDAKDQNERISGVIWNDACDGIYPLLKEASDNECMIRITSPNVKYSNPNFKKKGFPDVEITFEDGLEVVHDNVRSSDVVTIDTLVPGMNVSIHGIVLSGNHNSKYNTFRFTVVDDSNHSVNCTCWKVFDSDSLPSVGDLVTLRNVSVESFSVISLSVPISTRIIELDDSKREQELRGWYENIDNHTLISLSQMNVDYRISGRTSIRSLCSSKFINNKAYGVIKGIITEFKESYYMACSDTRKKCIEFGDGNWVYEKNNDISISGRPVKQKMIQCTIMDATQSISCIIFNSLARIMNPCMEHNMMFMKLCVRELEDEPGQFSAILNDFCTKIDCKKEMAYWESMEKLLS